MKNWKTIMVASLAILAGSSSMYAANDLAGAGAPGTVSATGTLEKYIAFNPISLNVNMADLGGPSLGTAMDTRVFGSSQADPSSLDGPDVWVTSPPTGNAAEIRFDSNSHLQLVIKNHAEMSNAGTVGIDAAGADVLPTAFRTWVKGSSVTRIKNSIPTVVTTDIVNYKDLGLTQSGGPNPLGFQIQPVLQFGHGPDSGVKLDVQVTRAGENDHYGTYQTSATLTWTDLD